MRDLSALLEIPEVMKYLQALEDQMNTGVYVLVSYLRSCAIKRMCIYGGNYFTNASLLDTLAEQIGVSDVSET